MKRTLEIDVRMLVEAMTRSPELAADLDLETGEIDLYPTDADWDDEAPDRGESRFEVPRLEAPVLYEWMRELASSVDEDDVRERLEDALDGRGAFGRFRRALDRYPDVAARWRRLEAERVIEEARPWLASLDVAPVFRSPDPAESPAAPGAAPPAPVTLVDLLLLGAPDGKTELLEGRVHRVLVAGSASEARAVFKAVARDLCEMHGVAWRNRFIEGRDRYETDRYMLTVEGRRVELAISVSIRLWKTFTGG